ncbi:SRPBCC family protein [Pseudonocardia saturnea]
MSQDRSLQVSGTIDAPPDKAFALLADPARHTELDGAGMLRGLDSGGEVSSVGDAFVMRMNQDGIGDYMMRSEVTDFEPGRRIAWAPAIHPPGSLSHVIGELDPSGHTYAWELEPTPEGGTRVTHTYDWSGVTDEGALALYPRVSEEQMAASITRLGEATG